MPPTLEGERIEAVRRRGKHLIVDAGGGLSLLIHLMSAGRLQLYDKRAGPRDRTSRLLVRVRAPARGDAADAPGGATGNGGPAELELRLREFGSKQAAWVKLLPTAEVEQDEAAPRMLAGKTLEPRQASARPGCDRGPDLRGERVVAREDAAGRGVDPVRGKAGIEVGEIGHGRTRSQAFKLIQRPPAATPLQKPRP